MPIAKRFTKFRVRIMSLKVKHELGFSLIEVLAATAIVAGLGLAIYKLQLASLGNSQQIVTRQLMTQYSDSLINQMYTHLNVVGNGDDKLYSLYLEPGYSGATLNERNYYVDSNMNGYDSAPDHDPSELCNTGCSEKAFAANLALTWKYNVVHRTNLPSDDVHATICRDYAMKVPTFDNPNCDSPNGHNPLVLKIIWRTKMDNNEKNYLGNREDNYLMFRVPERFDVKPIQ